MNKLTMQDVLVYYDGPQVFTATDGTETYVCIAEEYNLYLCVPVTQKELSLYLDDKINELALFTTMGEYPVVEMCDNGSLFVVKMLKYEQIPQDWFPLA